MQDAAGDKEVEGTTPISRADSGADSGQISRKVSDEIPRTVSPSCICTPPEHACTCCLCVHASYTQYLCNLLPETRLLAHVALSSLVLCLISYRFPCPQVKSEAERKKEDEAILKSYKPPLSRLFTMSRYSRVRRAVVACGGLVCVCQSVPVRVCTVCVHGCVRTAGSVSLACLSVLPSCPYSYVPAW